jgi:hypothetical protein
MSEIKTADHHKTNATLVEIQGYLAPATCKIATKVLNEDPYCKIQKSYYDTATNTRVYVLVETKEPFIKYVGEKNHLPAKLIGSGFEVVGKYYICNIKAVHTLDLTKQSESPDFDVLKAIETSDIYQFAQLPYIDYTITKKDSNIFEFKLEYNADLQLDKLKSRLA